MTSPLPVEITNHTDWWQPYVPPLVGLLGSVVVAAAAFFGVVKSNRTNLHAIEAADKREREKWHRDNLLRICSEAVRVSREISHHYNEAAGVSLKLSNPDDFDNAFWKHMDAAQTAIDKVAPLSYDMRLLGESRLFMEFQEVREVGEFVGPAFVQYHRYLVANFTRIRAALEGDKETGEAMTAEIHASIEFRRYDKATRHLNIAHLDFQLAAQQKISPDSLPKGELPSMDMDLPPRPPGASPNPYRRPSSLDWNAGDTAEPEPKD